MILCFFLFSKIIPSFFLIKRAALGNLKVSFHCAHWHRFFPLKKAPPFSPSLSSIVFTTPSVPLIGDRNPQEREDATALRCSEPLRYKVGGPAEVYASSRAAFFLCGDKPDFTQGFAKSICPFRRAGCVSFLYFKAFSLTGR